LEDENDIYCDRAERAISGLEQYKKQFKQFTPEMQDKENVNPEAWPASTPPINSKNSRRLSGSSNSGKSSHPRIRPVSIEDDHNVLIRRQKDIDYGKNQSVYAEYLQNVEKEDRSDRQPWTPDKYEKMTRRNWDKQIKIWRKQMHYWRDPKPIQELMTPGTSPCPSPHRRRSPEREGNAFGFSKPENLPGPSGSARGPTLNKALFGNTIKDEFNDENAMSGFPESNILSENAKNVMKKEETMDDNSNSCMSVSEDIVPVMFRK